MERNSKPRDVYRWNDNYLTEFRLQSFKHTCNNTPGKLGARQSVYSGSVQLTPVGKVCRMIYRSGSNSFLYEAGKYISAQVHG